MTTEFAGEATVELPGGLALDEGRLLTRAVLRPLSGFDEEWLAEASNTPGVAKVTRLLSSCLVTLNEEPATTGLVRNLLLGDRDYLVLQLRRLTLGDEIRAVVDCPACGAPMDVDFRVAEIPVLERRQEGRCHEMTVSGRAIRFRLPTGGDLENLLESAKGAAARHQPTKEIACSSGGALDSAAVLRVFLDGDHREGAERLLDCCLLDDGGQPLSHVEREAIVDEMERLAPKVDAELDLNCPECQHSFVEPFDATAFFFDEMRVNGRQLLREVHTLALYYHWSQSDILQMCRRRRHEYLALLSDALRQD